MLYKPTSPSPYAQCVISDSDYPDIINTFTGYYIDDETSAIVSCESDEAIYIDGVIYVYPVKKDYLYNVSFTYNKEGNNTSRYFKRLALGFSTNLSEEGQSLSGVVVSAKSKTATFTATEDGYLYVNPGNLDTYPDASRLIRFITLVNNGFYIHDKFRFTCSMMGGAEIETARLKISDGNTQYYFGGKTLVELELYEAKCVGGSTGKILTNENEEHYVKISSIDNVYTYRCAVREGYIYNVNCRNNNLFRLGYSAPSALSMTNINLTPISEALYEVVETIDGVEAPVKYFDDSLQACTFKNTYGKGYLYLSFYKGDALSNQIVEITEESSNGLSPSLTIEDTSSTKIEFDTISSSLYGGYKIADNTRSTMDDLRFFDVVSHGKEYTWQTRLYEKDSLTNDKHRGGIWLGYGTIEEKYLINEITQATTTDTTICSTCFKIRPHTNIFFKNSTNGKEGTERLYQYYDCDARYYLKANGEYYPIRDYRFYMTGTLSAFDSYGEPYYGYATIDYNAASTIKAGDKYEIYCNYIDSDEYYFNTALSPNLILTEAIGNKIEGTKNSPYLLPYSNLNLKGSYDHGSGAKIEKYSVVLYDSYENIIDETGDVYSGNLTYSYEKFMTGNAYKLTFTVYDSLGFKLEKNIYLAVEYNFESEYITGVDANFYKNHDSVIIELATTDNVTKDYFTNGNYFDVYKKIGNNQKLHKVYSITSTSDKYVIEDFAVGNLCDYTYVVYPVKVENSGDYELKYLGTPIESSPINYNYGATTIFGLIQDESDINTYTINYDELWRFELNLENTGTTLNIDKTFVDSQNRFPKMLGGNRKYNTVQVKGLIGYYDCKKGEYVDNYDLLEEWENFATNNHLKLLKDRRGRLIPCDIESSSFEYMNVIDSPASVSFSARQLESMDNLTILGRRLIHNPIKSNILTTSDGEILTDINVADGGQALISQES